VKHAPNALSAARILLTPYVCYLLAGRQNSQVLAWFAVAAITDAFDGWLARALKVESPLGQVLDPVADKVLLTSVFLTLGWTGMVPWWLVALVIGRDVLILLVAGGMYAKSRRRSFPPSIWGKLSTIVQMLFVLSVVGELAAEPTLRIATAILTVCSGADYGRRVLS
jgi:cardiolipin synthase (CMP-forming)